MITRSSVRKLLPVGALSGLMVVAALAPAGPLASVFAGYQYNSPLGGGLIGGPDVAAGSATNENIYVQGTDKQLWSMNWNGTSYGNFLPRGGGLTSDPGATAVAATTDYAFVRGTDGQLYGIQNAAGTFGQWAPLGGQLVGGPDASSFAQTGGAHVDVFVRGTDGQLWHKWGDNGTWGGWEPQGGVLTADPGSVSWAAKRPGLAQVLRQRVVRLGSPRWWCGGRYWSGRCVVRRESPRCIRDRNGQPAVAQGLHRHRLAQLAAARRPVDRRDGRCVPSRKQPDRRVRSGHRWPDVDHHGRRLVDLQLS